MVCPMMGEDVLPDEEMPVQKSPLVPERVQEVTLRALHETIVVSPGCTREGVALRVADGGETT